VKRGKLTARLQLFGSGLCFGLMAALARLGSRDAGGFSAQQLAVVRFGVGIGLILALFWARPGTFRPVRHRLLVTRGVLGALAAVLYFVALARIPASVATLLNNTFPVWATLLSLFTVGERPGLHLAIALAVVTCGVVLVLGPGSSGLGIGIGEAAGLASALVGAGAVTSVRALRATDNAPTIFFAFCLGGLAVSAPFSFTAWPSGWLPWSIAIGVGVSSTFAQLLMTEAYGALTVPEAALWQQLTPLAATIWALFILDERLSSLGMIGIVVGVIGVAYGTAFGYGTRAVVLRPEAATDVARRAEDLERVDPAA
jgi:drug/metabolite transporter (DMT)-like permease